MAATVEIITGISGAGKTSRLVAEYRTELNCSIQNRSPGTALWLTPTHRSFRHIRSTLFEKIIGECESDRNSAANEVSVCATHHKVLGQSVFHTPYILRSQSVELISRKTSSNRPNLA